MYIQQDKIYNFSIECFKKVGMSVEDAELITDTMLTADYREIHSHGFVRLPIYIERIQKEFINVNPVIQNINNNNSATLMDGDYGAGQVVGKKAMENSINKAKESGLGLTVVKNSNHFGIAAYYASLATQENMIGIVFSNVEPLMPVIGGAEKVIGNNPISIAAPSHYKKSPIILDMALSNVPLGKVIMAQTKGESIPKDWGVDKHGEKTDDPNAVINGGYLYPMGGPKGFGLALMTEILTGIISGGEYSKTIHSMYDLDEKQSISHFMLAIDISFFSELEGYLSKIENLTSFVKDSRKAPGIEETFLPGEIEFKKEKENKKNGVPVDEKVFKELQILAKDLEIDFIQ